MAHFITTLYLSCKFIYDEIFNTDVVSTEKIKANFFCEFLLHLRTPTRGYDFLVCVFPVIY